MPSFPPSSDYPTGLRDPNSDGPGSAGRFNRVRQFIREQMEQPPMPATQTTAAAFRGRRRRARKRQVPAGLNSEGGGDIHKSSATGGETPRCLREGPQVSEALRWESCMYRGEAGLHLCCALVAHVHLEPNICLVCVLVD
jgi:hypothetical protein